MRRIIYKNISKTRYIGYPKVSIIMKKLRKKGFKGVVVTDAVVKGRGSKRKGYGTRIEAFKGKKKVPAGWKTKMEEY